MDLGARKVDLDALEVDLVALGVGLGARSVSGVGALSGQRGAPKFVITPDFNHEVFGTASYFA